MEGVGLYEREASRDWAKVRVTKGPVGMRQSGGGRWVTRREQRSEREGGGRRWWVRELGVGRCC